MGIGIFFCPPLALILIQRGYGRLPRIIAGMWLALAFTYAIILATFPPPETQNILRYQASVQATAAVPAPAATILAQP